MSNPVFSNAIGRYLWQLSELRRDHSFFSDLLAACRDAEPVDAGDLETILDAERKAFECLRILNEVLNGKCRI